MRIEGRGFDRDKAVQIFVGDREASEVHIISDTELTALFPTSGTPGFSDVAIANGSRHAALADAFFYEASELFVRGDVDRSLVIDITDPVLILTFLLLGGPATGLDAHDSNDNGIVETSDSILTLTFFFLDNAHPPPPPYPNLGVDPTRDDFLSCP